MHAYQEYELVGLVHKVVHIEECEEVSTSLQLVAA